MTVVRTITRDRAIEDLIEHCVDEDCKGHTFSAVLREGCVGYDNISTDDILEEYNNIFSTDDELFIIIG